MSMHYPVNHPLRPIYRTLAFLAGAFVLSFGIVGFINTQGTPLFEAGGETALGLRTNLGFSMASVLVGVLVTLATVLGRNIDRFVYLWAGYGFLLAGTVMLLLMGRQSTNFLNFTIVTCMVSYAIGSVWITAGMYAKVKRT